MYPTFGPFGSYGLLSAYGTPTLTESSPPQSWIEPLTTPEAGNFLKLPESVFNEPPISDELALLISQAREQAEIYQNCDLVRKQWDIVFDYWPPCVIELRAPLISVDLAQYRNSTGTVVPLIVNTDYIVDTSKRPGVIAEPYGKTWPSFTPWPTSALMFRYTSGYAPDSIWWSDAGARIKSLMKLLIADWFSNRTVNESAVGAVPERIALALSQGAVPRVK